jgi:agmatinase
MDEILQRGLTAVIDQAVETVGEAAPRVYMTVDIDVLDPAFAPGTGTPEPGGFTTRELLWTARHAARTLDLCAADIVEVCPPFDHAGITALAAERVALEILAGTAARRRHPGVA